MPLGELTRARRAVSEPSPVLDTHVSLNAIAQHVEYRSLWSEHDPPYGYTFRCQRCGWRSPARRWLFGAVSQGERHSMACPQ